jgi:hypothetical protein
MPANAGVTIASFINSSWRTDPESDSLPAASIDVVAEVDDNQTRTCWCDVAPINIEMSQDENGAVNGNATSRTSTQALMLRIELETTLLVRATNDVPDGARARFFEFQAIRDGGVLPFRQKRVVYELEPTSMSL